MVAAELTEKIGLKYDAGGAIEMGGGRDTGGGIENGFGIGVGFGRLAGVRIAADLVGSGATTTAVVLSSLSVKVTSPNPKLVDTQRVNW